MTVLQAPIEARPPDFIIFLGSIQQKPRKGCLAFKKPSSFYFSEVANFADALRNLLLLLFKFVEFRILRNVQAPFRNSASDSEVSAEPTRKIDRQT